jgi:hypothetical protein
MTTTCRHQAGRVQPNWTRLGGRDIRPGIALAANHLGQLEFFVVGGDGALYRGPRGLA